MPRGLYKVQLAGLFELTSFSALTPKLCNPEFYKNLTKVPADVVWTDPSRLSLGGCEQHWDGSALPAGFTQDTATAGDGFSSSASSSQS